MKGLLGRKLGMTRVFGEDGQMVPVTVVEAGPCTVLDVRTTERHGYSALQLGFGQRKMKNVLKPIQGHITNAGMTEFGPEWIREVRLDADSEEEVGNALMADVFSPGEFIDVIGTSKGKGFQGVVRRYKFGGGRATHGGGWLRKPGSIGMCEHPGEVYKGRKMPGQMGNKRCTLQNLKVVQVRKDENLLLIKGGIPGGNGRFVIIRQAKKKGAATT